MSQEQKNLSCSLCHSYLFEDDDVVYCPVCGAPHHRECYHSIGHCALESAHGTEQQYDKIKRSQEPKEELKEKETENTQKSRFGFPFEDNPYFDFLGGVPKNQLIDDGITAEDAKNFVISNTTRYIPKFAKLSKHSKISWNFMAFIFPCGWFLSRKMYKNGIIAGVLNIVALLFSVPLNNLMYNLGIMDSVSYYDMLNKMMDNVSNIDPTIVFIAFIGMWLRIAISLVCALFGDYLYKVHAVNTIREIKQYSTDLEYDYRKKGGVSIILFIIGIMAVEYIPSIIATFI